MERSLVAFLRERYDSGSYEVWSLELRDAADWASEREIHQARLSLESLGFLIPEIDGVYRIHHTIRNVQLPNDPVPAAARPDASFRPAAAREVKKRSKGVTINAQMLDTITKRPEARQWSIQQWTTHLDCSRSTVHDTLTWKELMKAREAAKQEKLAEQTFTGRDGKRKRRA